MNIINTNISLEKVKVKTIDILGREVNDITNQIFLEIYDDGSSKKRIIID